MNHRAGAPMSASSKIIKIPCETYSRVVGYFRPVDQWNHGKRTEFKERQDVKIPETYRR